MKMTLPKICAKEEWGYGRRWRWYEGWIPLGKDKAYSYNMREISFAEIFVGLAQ